MPRTRTQPGPFKASRGLSAALLAMAVAACTAQPLYAPDPSPTASAVGSSPFAGMVDIQPTTTRVAQVVRNELLFELNGSGSSSADNAVLSASLSVTSFVEGRFRVPTSTAGQTSASIANVTGTLTLTDASTGQPVQVYTRSALAPYDLSNQDFANQRAELDAENRAANELAEQFAALIAAELRKRQ